MIRRRYVAVLFSSGITLLVTGMYFHLLYSPVITNVANTDGPSVDVGSRGHDILAEYPGRPSTDVPQALKDTAHLMGKTSTNASDKSFVRGVLLYVPTHDVQFAKELRWLVRSWQEMLLTQPEGWRTDIVAVTNKIIPVFDELKCRREQRKSREEPSMCVVIDGYDTKLPGFEDYTPVYSVHVATWSGVNLEAYDWILRTDVDTFLTPGFSKWRPSNMIVGGGGYIQGADLLTSHRLERISDNLRLKYKGMHNIGSTWFGPVALVRRGAAISLECMRYLKKNEFTKLERSSAFGVQGWPEWHYGVLSMYGGHLAINHLATDFTIEIKTDMLDFYSTSSEPAAKHPHIHTWHTDEMFSKFVFFMNGYRNVSLNKLNPLICKDYCMYMALDSDPELQKKRALTQH